METPVWPSLHSHYSTGAASLHVGAEGPEKWERSNQLESEGLVHDGWDGSLSA